MARAFSPFGIFWGTHTQADGLGWDGARLWRFMVRGMRREQSIFGGTDRTASAKTTAKASATAGSSAPLRFAQDDGIPGGAGERISPSGIEDGTDRW